MLPTQLLLTSPAVNLRLGGLAHIPAAAEEPGGGLGWIWVLIALLLLIPLLWWLRRSGGPQRAADHAHNAPTPTKASPADEETVTAATETATSAPPSPAVTSAPAETPQPGPTLAAAVQEAAPPTRRAQASTKPDDLTIIEGIGPKISRLLQDKGIKTFAELAAADLNRVEEILSEAGLSNITEPSTWPEQAQLAAEGKWDELKAWQHELKAGRRA